MVPLSGSSGSPVRRDAMRRPLLVVAALAIAFFCALVATRGAEAAAAETGARAKTAGHEVEQWGMFEVEARGPADGNPFVDVHFAASFTNGARTLEIPGFYDGDGVYRVRFMPDETGEWRYETHSNRWELTRKTGTITVVAPKAGNHGPVRVANTYHFAYADGTPYRQIGTTIYTWLFAPEAVEDQTLKSLAASPFNKVRSLVFPQDGPYGRDFPTPRFPFAGTPPQNWDFTRFNPDFFRHYEKRLAQMRDLGIEADLILFHPYGKKWGFDSMDAASDDRYLHYIVARFAAFRNVWWSMANEYDFLRTKTEADWDRFFQIVATDDPYHHLRSIHNGALLYNHTHEWVTHVSIQNGAAVEEPGRAELYRDVYRKPIVYDEVKYEGHIASRWGQLTGQEMTLRFWNGTVAGTYVGHSETLSTPGTRAWLAYGGALHGESPARIAFLKKVLEDSPASGIEPIDKWQDGRVGGKRGEYYLIYFGNEKPVAWPFHLFRDGITDGMRFQIEVLDTWDMTITPVPGEFVAKKKDQYEFVDAQARSVTLPGKPYMALRIRRIGAAAPAAAGKATDAPEEP